MQTMQANLIPMARLERAAGVMRVLAHPHRLRICELLMHERITVGALAEHLQIPHNAVSQHLNIMKAHGILTCRRRGKAVYYQVVDPRPAWLLGCIREHDDAVGSADGVESTGQPLAATVESVKPPMNADERR